MARPRQNVVNNVVMKTKELIDLNREISISGLRSIKEKFPDAQNLEDE
mgnify:CR=1 FL=1